MDWLLQQFEYKRLAYIRALRRKDLSQGQYEELKRKLDAVAEEIEALSICPTCHHMGRHCTCPF